MAAKATKQKAKAAKENTTMTEKAASRPRRGPGISRLAGTSVGLVAVVFVLLAQRVASGSDPVLKAARPPAPRPVVLQRIVKRVVIDTTIRSHGHAGAANTVVSSSPVTTSQSGGGEAAAPVTRSS